MYCRWVCSCITMKTHRYLTLSLSLPLLSWLLCAGDTALPRTLPQPPPPQPAQRSGIVIGLSNNAGGRFEDDLSTAAAARPAAPRAFSLPAARTGGGGGGIVIGSTGRRRRFAVQHWPNGFLILHPLGESFSPTACAPPSGNWHFYSWRF